MADLSTISNTETLALAIKAAIGHKPTAVYYADHSELSFTPEQVQALQGKLREQVALLKKTPPGKVRVNINPIILPVILQETAPFIIGALLLSFLAGRITK